MLAGRLINNLGSYGLCLRARHRRLEECLPCSKEMDLEQKHFDWFHTRHTQEQFSITWLTTSEGSSALWPCDPCRRYHSMSLYIPRFASFLGSLCRVRCGHDLGMAAPKRIVTSIIPKSNLFGREFNLPPFFEEGTTCF